MKPAGLLRETLMNVVLYRAGLGWRLYRWYQRGGSARLLSMFIGRSIKFWRGIL